VTALASLLLGLAAGASLLPFTRGPLAPATGRVLLLLASLLFGAVIAALFFADLGWLAVLGSLPGIVLFYASGRRRRRERTLLDVSLSSQRQVEAEALMARIRRGEEPADPAPTE
jgi:lysylphosphatidylglycerol synthetase-like protein (DUF2156 family)